MKLLTILISVLVALALLAACNSQSGAEVRSIDGTGNNLDHPMWGSAGSQLRRVARVDYADGISTPAGETRPSTRVISNALCAQSFSVPDEDGRSDFTQTWGQFLSHDLSFVRGLVLEEPFYILVPAGDPCFDPEGTGDVQLELNRAIYDPQTGTDPDNPRQQLNVTTAWIDASMVYGTDQARADWLRTGVGGRLKVLPHPSGDLLPLNDGTQFNMGGYGTDLFVAGDPRCNTVSNLAVMSTLFVREHNRLADEIAAEHPDWSDEQIYQQARRFVIAEIQVITYQEFIPAMLGEGALEDYDGYDPDVDPTLVNAFDTAAFRTGHSQVGMQLLRLDANGDEIAEGNLAIRDCYFDSAVIIEQGGIEPILRGLAAQVQQATDLLVVDDIRNFFFPKGFDITDLIAIDIQRGREHGLPDYNSMRRDFGLEPVHSFAEITSDVAIQASLEATYGSVNDIDPLVGMLAEDHLPGACVGELAFVILKQQFEALRDGDRFWYAIDPAFTPEEIVLLESTRLSDIIIRNTTIENIQPNVFFVVPSAE